MSMHKTYQVLKLDLPSMNFNMAQISSIPNEIDVNHRAKSILIVARKRRQDILQMILRTVPQLKIIDPVNDNLSALTTMAAYRPALVLLDANLPGSKPWNILKQIKQDWPQTPCLVLADTIEQQQTAQAAGADIVLGTEISISKLRLTIEGLLCRQTEDN